jgi:hypothetical protein
LRVAALDSPPLSPIEGARALEAFRIFKGVPGEYADAPLLTNLIALCFALFTADDGIARLPTALAGWLLCLTPLLFRSWLGGAATLGATVLLALSPVGALASRSVDPAILQMLALAVAVAGGLRYWERAEHGWLLAAVAALALGLGSGSAFIGQVLAVCAAGALVPPLSVARPPGLPRAVVPAIAVFLGVAFVADTLLLTRPGGLQAGLVDPLTDWLGQVGFVRTSAVSLGLLGLHELPALALAAWGTPRALRTPFGRFLIAWLLTGLLLGLLRRPAELAGWLGLAMPLALLAGHGCARLGGLVELRAPGVRALALALLAPIGFLFLATNASIFTTAGRGGSASPVVAGIAVGGLVAICLLASNWLGLRQILVAFTVAGLLLLGGAGLGSLTRLSYVGHQRAAPLLQTTATRPEIRVVTEQAAEWWRQSPLDPILVDEALRPQLQWALRDAPRVEWIDAPPRSPDRALLGPLTAPEQLDTGYVRTVVAESYSFEAPNLAAAWRWLFQRQPSVSVEQHAILVRH